MSNNKLQYQKDIPRCSNCPNVILNGQEGYFKLNKISNKFDLYCKSCYTEIYSGKDTV